MENVVIFEIDEPYDLHRNARFMRHLDTYRAMGRLQHPVKLCIGCWEGQLNRSYLMDVEDYKDVVAKSGYLTNQECVMHVDEHGISTLVTPDLIRPIKFLRDMRRVNAPNVRDGWTYVEEEHAYYAAV